MGTARMPARPLPGRCLCSEQVPRGAGRCGGHGSKECTSAYSKRHGKRYQKVMPAGELQASQPPAAWYSCYTGERTLIQQKHQLHMGPEASQSRNSSPYRLLPRAASSRALACCSDGITAPHNRASAPRHAEQARPGPRSPLRLPRRALTSWQGGAERAPRGLVHSRSEAGHQRTPHMQGYSQSAM